MIITGYGSTETAPFASTTTWPVGRPGEIGLPAPGMEFKLVPDGEKLELRLRGPNITPGYWRQPDKTAESFDEEGFYRIGDALKFVDPADPNKGFLFDGRVVGGLQAGDRHLGRHGRGARAHDPRLRALCARRGADRARPQPCRRAAHPRPRCRARLAPELAGADEAALAAHAGLRALFQQRLDALAAESTGSSNLVARAIILDTPLSIDPHEITDKGSINQRAVMAARAGLVEDLYAEPPPAHVLSAARAGG